MSSVDQYATRVKQPVKKIQSLPKRFIRYSAPPYKHSFPTHFTIPVFDGCAIEQTAKLFRDTDHSSLLESASLAVKTIAFSPHSKNTIKLL